MWILDLITPTSRYRILPHRLTRSSQRLLCTNWSHSRKLPSYGKRDEPCADKDFCLRQNTAKLKRAVRQLCSALSPTMTKSHIDGTWTNLLERTGFTRIRHISSHSVGVGRVTLVRCRKQWELRRRVVFALALPMPLRWSRGSHASRDCFNHTTIGDLSTFAAPDHAFQLDLKSR